jgi:hypothetical protein
VVLRPLVARLRPQVLGPGRREQQAAARLENPRRSVRELTTYQFGSIVSMQLQAKLLVAQTLSVDEHDPRENHGYATYHSVHREP